MHGSYTTFAGIYESNYYTRALYSALGSYTRRYAILCTIIADCQVLYHAQNLMSQMYEVCMQYCTKDDSRNEAEYDWKKVINT